MVFESVLNPFSAESHPGRVFFAGLFYGTLAWMLAVNLFPNHASTIQLFFIGAASIPLMYNIIRFEEEKDFAELDESVLLKEHSKAVLAYFMLFAGVTIALTFAFLILPEEKIAGAFAAQIETYKGINPHHQVVGENGITGYATNVTHFSNIFFNNMRVLAYCILFSLMYGAGAIFILLWNASVIALAIGNTIRTKAAELAAEAGFVTMSQYLSLGAHTIFLRYGLHGALEVIAYIIAGFAGGIISVAVIRHHYKSRKFEHVLLDSADLILIAIGVLFIAGLWEVWITPVFY